MRAPFLMALPGSPSTGWFGVAPTSSGDLDELQPICLSGAPSTKVPSMKQSKRQLIDDGDLERM